MSLVWNEFENYAPRDGVFSGVFYVVGRIRLVSGVAVTALQLRETRNGPLLVPPHPMGRGWRSDRSSIGRDGAVGRPRLAEWRNVRRDRHATRDSFRPL